MRKLTPKGQFAAYIVMILFAGVLLTTMVLGMAAGQQVKRANQTVAIEIADDDTEPEALEIEDIQPVPELGLVLPLANVDNVEQTDDDEQPQKEIIICQVINGVKHFSNQFVG